MNSCAVLVLHLDYGHMDHEPNRRYLVVNEDMKIEHVLDHLIDFRKKYMTHYNSGKRFYEFFYDYRNGTFTLTHFPDLATESIYEGVTEYGGSLLNKIFDPQILVTDQFLWVLDRMPGNQRMIRYDLEFREFKTFDLSPRLKRGKLFDWHLDTLSNSNRVVCTRQEVAGKEIMSYVTTWDDNGVFDLDYKWPLSETGTKPTSIQVKEVEEGEQIVYGAYGRLDTKKSIGIYVKHVQDGSIMSTKRVPFYQMKHFFDYLSPQEKEDHYRRMKRLQRHEKDLNVSAWVNVYPLNTSEQGYLLAFDSYELVNASGFDVIRNGSPVYGIPQELYPRFSHAMVLRFDSNAVFKQDNFMPITDEGLNISDRKCLRQFQDGDTLHLLCSNSNMTYLAELKPNALMKYWTDTSMYVQEASVVDRRQEVCFAFGDSILVYGIKTKAVKEPRARKVHIYFIEKRKLR